MNDGMDRANAETGKDIGGKRGMIASLASISLVMTLGNSMLIPVLPIIEKQLHITSFQTSLLITMYSVVAIIFYSNRWIYE